MIKSMTGFGRAEAVSRERKVSVELKSVNHRYLDLNIKMPKRLSYFEGEIRNVMKTYIRRGKVDVFITYEDYTMGGMALKYNAELAKEYLGYLNQMSEELGIENDIRVSTLSRYPDVFTMEEQAPDEEELWNFLEGPLHEACRKFVETRQREGANLKQDLLCITIKHTPEFLTGADWPVDRTGCNTKLFFDLIQKIKSIVGISVHLIDKSKDRNVSHNTDLEKLTGLCLNTLGSIDDHNC